MDKPIRALVIAEAANPEWVSVPLIGWSLAKSLSEVADVHLVTQVRNREAICRYGYKEGVDFTSIDTEAVTAPIYKLASLARMGEGKGWTTLAAANAISYPVFERSVWKSFGQRICRREFDVVHRITPVSPTVVSSLARRCADAGVPFIIGPINGGVAWPKGFDSERRREREWLSYVRGLYKLAPGRAAMLQATSAILAGSRHTAYELPKTVRDKTIWLPENAVDPSRFNKCCQPHRGGVLRACFIGRLVPYKGADMLIEAARPLLDAQKMRLDIVGDGPMRGSLEQMVKEYGLVGAVTFHGNIEHKRVQDIAVENNVLTFPSVREFGGGVVLEAMALGLVPLVVDYAGPGELVDDEVGFKVPIGTRSEIILALRAVLNGIIADPSTLATKSKEGRTRVFQHFTWQAKACQILEVYNWLLGNSLRPPNLFRGISESIV